MKKNYIVFSIAALMLLAPLARAEEGKGGLKAYLGINADVRGRDHAEDQGAKEGDRRGDIRADSKTRGELNTRDRAIAEIDRRVASLNKLVARVDAMKRVSDSNKASIKATVKTEIDALTTLKAKIQADTDEATLKADIASITKSYRIYALVTPQLSIMAATDRIVTTADLMTTFGTKLETRIAEAKTAGNSVTTLEAAYADMKVQISEAKANASAALSLTVNLKPDNGDKTVADANRKALEDARAKIKAAHDDLKSARKDAETIVKGLKSFNVKVDASVKAKSEDR